MRVEFWGVRGSVPTPRREMLNYGGNTTCVQISAAGQEFIIDAGTGIIALGYKMMKTGPKSFTLLLTHLHHDHTQGFLFFQPAFSPEFSFSVYAGNIFSKSAREVLAGSMSDPYFPVPLSALASNISFQDIEFIGDSPLVEGLCNGVVDALKLFHPREGVVAYRFRENGKTIVFVTDCEHYDGRDEILLPFIEGADLFIYDTMYTDKEYLAPNGSKVGWGHSTIEYGMMLAEKAQVGMLVCTHHEPDHSDAFLDEIFAPLVDSPIKILPAREGLSLEV